MKGTLYDNRTKDFRRSNSHLKSLEKEIQLGTLVERLRVTSYNRSGMPNRKINFVSLTVSMEIKVTS
jgi:hypothetical protein